MLNTYKDGHDGLEPRMRLFVWVHLMLLCHVLNQNRRPLWDVWRPIGHVWNQSTAMLHASHALCGIHVGRSAELMFDIYLASLRIRGRPSGWTVLSLCLSTGM